MIRAGKILFALLVVLAISGAPRWILHDRTPTETGESWIVTDPDSLYHARRVERIFAEGLPVASRDPLLNSPDGALIPWPPYYDLLAASLLAPFAPSAISPSTVEARRWHVEHGIGWLPFLFGLATSLLVFCAARNLGGTSAGLAAGTLHALSLASILYSRVGNGDHHSFVTMLSAAILWGCAACLKGERLAQKRVHLGVGSLLGVAAGFAIGSWVASLLLVIALDVVFAVLLLAHARKPRAGLPMFGVAFHLSALIALLPAVLQSPWKQEFPWMVVNLSWFHVAYLGCAVLVFVPLSFRRLPETWRRRHPWFVCATLFAIAAVSALLDGGPVPGIREGLAWVSRQDSFMAGVAESRPLIGEGAQAGEFVALLGWSIFLLPFAWLSAVLVLRRGQRMQLLPWLIVAPLAAWQAAGQARFADALSVPASVLIGWAVSVWWCRGLPRLPKWAPLLALPLLAAVGHDSTIQRMLNEGSRPRPEWRRARAARELCDWIALHTMPSTSSNMQGEAVLSNWNRGHEIEWAARRPSVATNFGSYVGEAGFLAPARFFLAHDPIEAEEVLHARGARFVVQTCFASNALPGWLRAGDPAWRGRFAELADDGSGVLLEPWYDSIGGQLLNGGHPHEFGAEPRRDSLDFMRLVHVSPTFIQRSPITSWHGPAPFGWVWERVLGARVELRGAPGELAAVAIQIEFRTKENQLLQRVQFLRRAIVEADGIARVRVPYATSGATQEGVVVESLWSVGEARGALRLSEQDVVEGRAVRVND